MLSRMGEVIATRAWAVIVAWVLILLGAGAYGARAIDHLSNEGGYNEQSDSYTAYDLYRKHFQGTSPNVTVLYSSDTMTVSDPRFMAAVRGTLAALPHDVIVGVVNGLDAPPAARMVSEDRHSVKVFVAVRQTDVPQMVDDFRSYRGDLVSKTSGVRTDIAGILPMGDDMLRRTQDDSRRAEAIALPIVFLLSLLVFGGLVAALLPPLIGLISVTVALAAMRFVTTFTPVASTVMLIVTLLGMGLAIDYCLFVISRFREELGTGRGRRPAVDAMGPTLHHAGRTVILSALVVSVAVASLLVFPIDTVRSIAYGAIPAVLTAMAASVTLLPAILAVLSHRINAIRLPGMRARTEGADHADTHGLWARVARAVMRRPWVYLVSLTTVLLALGTPALGAHWGSVDLTLLPRDSSARVAQDRIDRSFGGGHVLGWTMYEGDPAEVPSYVRGLNGLGMTTVVPQGTVRPSGAQPITFLYYTWPGTNQSRDSHDMIARIRELPVPPASHAYVGGETASSVDQVSLLRDRLPLMLLAVAASMTAIMGLAFRSLVLPLKAVVVSGVSIAASSGVVTWVFQDGHLSGPLGFEAPGFLEVSSVLIMATILFGLSMDYEIFLLSRVYEEYLRTGDNASSVAHGLARTGRIITGAALLLAVVIGGFVASSLVFMKMVGLGMLVAVLLDATVVRGLLVPAAMKLLGRWNWWPGAPVRR